MVHMSYKKVLYEVGNSEYETYDVLYCFSVEMDHER